MGALPDQKRVGTPEGWDSRGLRVKRVKVTDREEITREETYPPTARRIAWVQ